MTGFSDSLTVCRRAGFFAPDNDRAALWTGAFRLLNRIDSDQKFHPVPDGHSWTEDMCAERLALSRELLALLERLGKGDFTRPTLPRFYCGHSYFELPPRLGGEPRFLLPKTTGEFSLEIPAQAAGQADPARSAPAPPAQPETSEGVQLSLF